MSLQDPLQPNPSEEAALDHILSQAPLQEPSAWFTTQTVAFIRRSEASQKRFLRWIWSAAGALALVIVWTGLEIREQSNSTLISLASLSEITNDDGSEEAW